MKQTGLRVRAPARKGQGRRARSRRRRLRDQSRGSRLALEATCNSRSVEAGYFDVLVVDESSKFKETRA